VFFIGIFGIEDKEKPIRDYANTVCPDCGRLTCASFFERYTYFHLFFIPTFRWNKRFFVTLRCCGALYEADPAYAERLKTSDSVDFSRLSKVYGGFSGYNGVFARCRNCGAEFDARFSFCPHCGAKK